MIQKAMIHIRPFLRFIKNKTSSGMLLIGVTAIALFLANSPWSDQYFNFWETKIGFSFGDAALKKPLFYWINDGLMAIFFFVIGLEIKRELMVGELSKLKKAALPIFAAAGGILTPAVIYIAINWGEAYVNGWAIPVATDIAFSLGILALLGSRVPDNLKILLTALAIVDDMGAVLAIAIFYTEQLSFTFLFIGLGFFVVMLILNRLGVRNIKVYGLIAIFGLWLPLLLSGVHATIGGILAALAIPAKRRLNSYEFREGLYDQLSRFFKEGKKRSDPIFLTGDQQDALISMKTICERSESPLQRIENNMHPWAIYFVMPVFAFANTGVVFSSDILSTFIFHPVSWGIILGLVVGKSVGITLFSYIATRLKLASLPEGVAWSHIFGLALLAGIGFTMSLFISDLAFHGNELVAVSKKAIFSASLVAGVAGFLVLRAFLPKKTPEDE